MVLVGRRPGQVRYVRKKQADPSDWSYIGSPELAAARGRGESGLSGKGENGENSGFVEGLKPSGALTAIISASRQQLRHRRPATVV
jgi:hypothetical protein